MNRAKTDLAPHAEAFLYRLAETFQVHAPRARYAKITYVDTADGKPFERNAFILESHGDLGKRINAKKKDPDAEGNIEVDLETIPKRQLAPLYFFQNLIGNVDYMFPITTWDGNYYRPRGTTGPDPFWNIKIFQDKTTPEKLTVVPYDFDLAAPIRFTSFKFDQKTLAQLKTFAKLGSNSAYVSWKTLQQLRSYFEPDELSRQRDFFNKRRNDVYQKLATAPINATAKKYLKTQFDGFYQALKPLLDTPLLYGAGGWYNDDLMTEDSECQIYSIMPMPARRLSPGRNDLVQVEVIDVFDTLLDGYWKACANPGFVSDKAVISPTLPFTP